MADDQEAALEYAPGAPRREPVDDRILRKQELQRQMEEFWRSNPANDPRLPVHEVPAPQRGNQIGRLDPKVLKALEQAHLPTIPSLALSPEFIGNLLGKTPLPAAAKIMKGAPVESVTGQDVLQLGSVMTPGYGRAAVGGAGLGMAGGDPKKITALINSLRGDKEFELEANKIFNEFVDHYQEHVAPTLSIALSHAKNIDEIRKVIALAKSLSSGQMNEAAERAAAWNIYRKRLGIEDFELGMAGGKRPPRRYGERTPLQTSMFGKWRLPGGEYRTHAMSTKAPPQNYVFPGVPKPGEVERFWQVFKATGNNASRTAEELNIREAQVRARLHAPSWSRRQSTPIPSVATKPGSEVMLAYLQLQRQGFTPSAIYKTLAKEFGEEAAQRIMLSQRQR